MNRTLPALLLALTALAGCSKNPATGVQPQPSPGLGAATPRATCGPGSNPETGIQGRVSLADHESGRAAEGYTCNIEMVGSYTTPNAIGTVGGFKVERYKDSAGRDCAYYDTTGLYPTNVFDMEAGVNVMDMSDPTQPRLATRLLTPAMLSPHESLIVNQQRGVLAAVTGNPAFYPGIVDLYDLSADCRSPVLKTSLPIGVLGHESGMSPDGMTFYSASPGTPTLTPIDISNLMLPRPMTIASFPSHGLSISNDGNRGYIADTNGQLVIIDTSQIQSRAANPTIREIARLTWDTVSIPQNAIPITIKGHPYLVEIDEFGAQSQVGAGRIIDIGDETQPKVISDLRLEVHNPVNFAGQAEDPGANNTAIGGYAGHYCNVPTRVDPPIVACSMILSGLRVFDIRDPHHPKEVAYYIPPVNPRIVSPPFHQFPVPGEASSYAMSSPSFVPERKEIWYSDFFNGFFVLRVTNGAW